MTNKPELEPKILKREGHPDLLYMLSHPPERDSDSPVPLIIALHYAGHGIAYYGMGVLTGLVGPAFEELGAMIASPDCPASHWATPEADAAIIALLDHLLEAYPIDARRVILTGFSMGGMGTWTTAARHPDRFSAAFPVAGAPPANITEYDDLIPVYAINSDSDEVIPSAKTGQAIDALREKGMRVGLLMIEGASHYQLERFVPALRSSVAWLRRVWELQDAGK